MPQKTGIEWTDYSSNPFRARDRTTGKTGHHCEKCSPGCANCYSEVLDGRFGIGRPYTQRETPNVEFYLAEKEIDAIIRHRKPGRCFVGDMTDLFGPWVPDEMLDDLFAAFHLNIGPDRLRGPLEFQILTKRPERMAAYIGTPGRGQKVMEAARRLAKGRGPAMMNHAAVLAWPLSSVWVGTSVEDQKRADERIPHLLRTPAVVRFLSVEPLLGPVWLTNKGYIAATGDNPEMYGYMAGPDDGKSLLCKTREEALAESGIHWVIVGGESGPNARPFDIQWARSIVAQCKAADVPVFVKQLGSRPVEGGGHYSLAGPGVCMVGQLERPIKLADRKGGNWFEWPADLRVREFPQVPARCD